MNLIRFVLIALIALIFASLVLLEIFIFIEFQYEHLGLNRSLCECKNLINPKQKGRIVNGTAVHKEDLKWVANLFFDYYDESTRVIMPTCTASVINNFFYLTAAHCLVISWWENDTFLFELYPKSILFFAVNFGHNMTKAYLPETPRRKIKNLFLYPAYDKKIVDGFKVPIHDIAIFEAVEPLVLGDGVLPACLIEQDFSKFENNFVVAGYGLSSYNELVLNESKRINLFKKDQLSMAIYKESSDCSEIEEDLDFNSNKICAFPQLLSDDWSVKRGDIFHGDSGGPLNYPILNSLFVAGITSLAELDNTTDFIYSDPNTTKIIEKRILFRPATFTRVYPYLSWIDRIVGGNRCTTKKKFKLNYIKCLIFGFIFLLTCLFSYFLFYYLGKTKNIFKISESSKKQNSEISMTKSSKSLKKK